MLWSAGKGCEGAYAIVVQAGRQLLSLEFARLPIGKAGCGIVARADEPSRSANAASVAMEAVRRAAAVKCTRETSCGIGETLHGLAEDLVVGAVALHGRLYHAVSAGA